MEWNELSNEAKAIIEWVENPYTKKRDTIILEVGTRFKRYCGEDGIVDILITDELFNEIYRFVSNDDNMECWAKKEMSFGIKDSSDLKLH